MKNSKDSPCYKFLVMVSLTFLASYTALASHPGSRMISAGETMSTQAEELQADTTRRPLTLDSLPAFASISMPSGREIVLERQLGGITYFDPEDPSVFGTLGPSDLAGIELEGIEDLGNGTAQGVITTQNRLGGKSALHVTVQGKNPGIFTALLRTSEGEMLAEYQIWLGADGSDNSLNDESLESVSSSAVLVFVITAAGIAAIGCTLAALLTECTTECSRACQEEPGCYMISSSEGWCGTCTCACQCSSGNPGLEPIW